MGLRDLSLDILYAGPGLGIAREFLLPCLEQAVTYDRLASYFNLGSFVSIGVGLESLRRKDGLVRLVMGAHDVDLELSDTLRAGEAADVVSSLRERLITGVTTLADELARSRIEATAWMLKDGLLRLKCAAPRGDVGPGGIFHSKRMIFSDASGDRVSATGSPNETQSGLGGNYEEVTVHRSWVDASGYVARHQERFDAVWEDRDPGLDVLAIDSEFADELLLALRRDKAFGIDGFRQWVADDVAARVVEVIQRSPVFATTNTSESPLFTHQEGALVAACSRWPIRAVLADEVGLGKTYEAAAAIRFAVRDCGVQRVLVLAPPSLLRQWQDELIEGFGLPFHRYEPSAKAFIGPNGERRDAKLGPFGDGDYPALAIVSREIARGTRARGHLFHDLERYPEMVVLDEAHAARKRRDASGSTHDSLLRVAIEYLASRVPHVLLLSATPLQLDAQELHDLLALLGLPPGFDASSYARSLTLLATSPDMEPELDVVSDALRLIDMSLAFYQPRRTLAPDEILHGSAREPIVSPDIRTVVRARSKWKALHERLVRFHPVSLMTVRNTRNALERAGYRFPRRVFRSVETKVTADVSTVLQSLDAYLTDGLGTVERVLYPERATAYGFLVSTYRQRVASSLASALDTLSGRRRRVQSLVDEGAWAEEEAADEEVVTFAAPLGEPRGAADVGLVSDEAVKRACGIELAYLDSIIERLARIAPSLRGADPKMIEAMVQLRKFIAEGASCLVFSRYTSTIDSLVESYGETFGHESPYAVYTGEGGLLYTSGTTQRGSKKLVTDALQRGLVPVVFCSDAASEGLNLQAARAIVNVDVPWNPARLEQRIGRIARLGQRAEEVTVVNLWYPNSVEAKIYARVLERKDSIELALGGFPQIVGDAIRDAVRERFEGMAPGGDVLHRLQDARENLQLRSLGRLWSAGTVSRLASVSEVMRQRLLEVVQEIAALNGWSVTRSGARFIIGAPLGPIEVTAAADPDIGFTMRAPWLRSLLELAAQPRVRRGDHILGVLSRSGTPLMFAVRDGAWTRVLMPESLPDVLATLFLGSELDVQRLEYLDFQDPGGVDLVTELVVGRWPDPHGLTVPVPFADGLPQRPPWASGPALTLEPLARIQLVGRDAA